MKKKHKFDSLANPFCSKKKNTWCEKWLKSFIIFYFAIFFATMKHGANILDRIESVSLQLKRISNNSFN